MDTLMLILDPANTSGYPMVGDWLRRTLKADDCYVLGNVWAFRTTATPTEVHNLILETALLWPSTKFLVVPVAGRWSANNCASSDDCFG
jgi:hypothetical protein